MTILHNLREHKCYGGAFNPDIVFSKPGASTLRCYTNVASMGRGNIFFVVDRAPLNGKYIRFRWQGTLSSFGGLLAECLIFDGEYVRSSAVDFPSGADPPLKGAGLLQTVRSRNVNFGWETFDALINVAAGTQAKCTIFFRITDNSPANDADIELDWVEINALAGGAGNIASETFDDSVHMEVTGTLGDYGYISTGSVSFNPILTNEAYNITSDGATLSGTIVFGGPYDERGFEWGIISGVYTDSWTELGVFGAGGYTHPISGLASGVKIYYRAKLHNSGWNYGAEKDFTPGSAQIELRLSDIVPPTPEPPRTIYADVVSMPDPLTLGISFKSYNFDSITLYFQVVATGVGWTFPASTNFGSIASGANYTRNFDQYGTRARPAAETTEIITLTLKAYTDAGYTILRWTFVRTINVIIIKSDDGSWTTDFLNNFDDGTIQGWSATSVPAPSIAVANDFVLSVPWSLKANTNFPNVADLWLSLNKTFATPNRAKIYAIANLRFSQSLGTNWYFKAYTMSADGATVIYIGLGTLLIPNPPTRWIRFVFPLPPNVNVAIGLRVDGYSQTFSWWIYEWLDDFMIVSKN